MEELEEYFYEFLPGPLPEKAPPIEDESPPPLLATSVLLFVKQLFSSSSGHPQSPDESSSAVSLSPVNMLSGFHGSQFCDVGSSSALSSLDLDVVTHPILRILQIWALVPLPCILRGLAVGFLVSLCWRRQLLVRVIPGSCISLRPLRYHYHLTGSVDYEFDSLSLPRRPSSPVPPGSMLLKVVVLEAEARMFDITFGTSRSALVYADFMALLILEALSPLPCGGYKQDCIAKVEVFIACPCLDAPLSLRFSPISSSLSAAQIFPVSNSFWIPILLLFM
ncbi:unnamed protein product [Microthlaspi erraticum]|uniref:Uncharacterized protein n=1 Tax=Microthlaspi erraticum TaxID=1685480 RepID=A0A6D2JBY2_9BRAS|nr:unnamed protein product [Microthlaspi erraticum]